MIGLMILMGQDVQGLLWYVYLDMCFYFCDFRWKVLSEPHIHAVHFICSGSRYLTWCQITVNGSIYGSKSSEIVYICGPRSTRLQEMVLHQQRYHILLDHITSTQTPHNHHQSITGTIKYVSWPRWVTLLPQGHKLCPYRCMCKVYITHLQLNRRDLNCLIR